MPLRVSHYGAQERRGRVSARSIPGTWRGARGGNRVSPTLYSHSIVEGGFDDTSRATRFTPGISLMMRLEIVSIRSYGRRAQSAVMASSEVTARTTIG